MLLEYSGRVYPSLALTAFMAVTGSRDVTLRVANLNSSTMLVDTRSIPLDGKSNLLLRYRGPKRTFPYVSAVDVLRGQPSADTFKNKIVLVGTTALGTREVVSTPLDTLFAGVEVHATVADNLLQQDFIRRPEYGAALDRSRHRPRRSRRFSCVVGSPGATVAVRQRRGSDDQADVDDGRVRLTVLPTMGLMSALQQ